MKKINLSSWSRAEHFKFYLPFSQPYFNVVLELELKSLFDYCKAQQISFTAAYLYALHVAIGRYAPIRYRIFENKPVEVNNVALSSVFLKEDETFRFVPLYEKTNLSDYQQHYEQQKQHYLSKPLINASFLNKEDDLAQIYISILPWFKFTGFKHAENNSVKSGIPKIVFGQYQKKTGMIPISIEVHHALMDGLHISQFIDVFNQVISEIVDEQTI